MKKTLSVLLAIVMTICMFTAMTVVASAAETDSQSGIEATLVTDKNIYSAGEDIKVTVDVKNTNTYNVDNVNVVLKLPEGLTLKSGDVSISNVNIAAGETYSKEVVAIKEAPKVSTDESSKESMDESSAAPIDNPNDDPSTGNPGTGNNGNGNANSQQTGDNSNMVLWVVLIVLFVAVIFFIVKFRKKVTKVLGLFLCAVMVCAIVPAGVFAAESGTNTVDITVDKTITVDGSKLTIKAMVETAPSDGGYCIDILSSYGGTVKGVSGNYKADSKIDIEATPDDGWIFVNWESANGGKFEDNKSSKTTFTTPDNSTTVVARFIRKEQSEIHDNTEDDLIALNKNAEYDLEIEYNDDETQVEFISGKYSEINVNSIDTAISSIYSVKSLIGLTDPASELSFSAVNHDEYICAYSFGQIYNGIPVYGRTVTVNADSDSGEARAISSSVLPKSVLSSISLTPSVSIENLSKNYVINSYELVIYSLNDYEESPVLAYVLDSDGEIIIVDADNADVLLRFQTSNDR